MTAGEPLLDGIIIFMPGIGTFALGTGIVLEVSPTCPDAPPAALGTACAAPINESSELGAEHPALATTKPNISRTLDRRPRPR